MNKEINEMIKELVENNSDDVEPLIKVVNMFSHTTDEENDALIAAARGKLADIFTIEVLKDMDQHLVSTDVLNLLLSAKTVYGYDITGAFQVLNEEDSPSLFILMIIIQVCDGSEILVINIQEVPNETN